MMTKETISTDKAPGAIGPYSQAIKVGDLVFCSGQIPIDPVTGELQKREYGQWIFTAFKLLAGLRGLRGSALDIFGYTQERRTERRLILDYEQWSMRSLND